MKSLPSSFYTNEFIYCYTVLMLCLCMPWRHMVQHTYSFNSFFLSTPWKSVGYSSSL